MRSAFTGVLLLGWGGDASGTTTTNLSLVMNRDQTVIAYFQSIALMATTSGGGSTGMMAEHFPGLRPAGNPADVWSTALAAAARQSGVVALLSAPGHMEDHQVIALLLPHHF